MARLSRGDLILLSRKRGLALALVLDPAADGWFRAVTTEGKARRYPIEQTWFGPIGHVSVPESVPAARETVEQLETAIRTRATELDLHLLRECALMEPRTYTLPELGDLLFGGTSRPEELGDLAVALHTDVSPFDLGDDGIRPLDEAALAERARAREAALEEQEAKAQRAEVTRQRRQAEREVLLPEVKRLLAGRVEADQLSPETVDWLRHLRETLLRDSQSLLNGALTCGGESIRLQDENHAVQLLTRGGVWNPDREDLAALRTEVGVPFTEEILSEAQNLIPREAPAEDLRDIFTFTVDSATTEDMDDAISIEAQGDDTRVWVHIADVERWIARDTALDRWGRDTAESSYLPEKVHHLFPVDLVREVSLSPGEDRYAFSLAFTVTADGRIADLGFSRSLVCSNERLSYEELDARVATDDAWQRRVRMIPTLRARRESHGARIPMLPDLQIRPTPDGISLMVLPTDTPSHRLVSELMIFFNEQVALFFREHGIPAIFKTQPGDNHDVEYPEESDPLYFPRIVRLLRPSVAGLDPEPHAFLGVDAYCQATSPIRRYQDLLHQRQLAAALNGTELPYTPDDVAMIYPLLEARSSEVRMVERRRRRYWLLRKLNELRGHRLKGIVSQIRPGGRPVVFFPDYLLETPLLLPPDFQLEIGDEVFVTPRKVDPIRGGVWARPAG